MVYAAAAAAGADVLTKSMKLKTTPIKRFCSNSWHSKEPQQKKKKIKKKKK